MRDKINEHSGGWMNINSFFADIFGVLTVLFLGLFMTTVNQSLGRLFEPHTVFLLSAIVGAVFSFRLVLPMTLFVSVGGSLFWWFSEAGLTDDLVSMAMLFFAVLVSFLLYLCSKLPLLRIYSGFGYSFGIYGVALPIVVTFYLSSMEGIEKLSIFMQPGISPFIIVSLILVAGIIFWLLFYSKIVASKYEIAGFGIILLIFGLLTVLSPIETIITEGYQVALMPAGFAAAFVLNILLFLELAMAVAVGFVMESRVIINISLVALFISLFFKYFDLFTFLDRSAFFFGAGFLLLVVGFFLDKSRRVLIDKMEHAK